VTGKTHLAFNAAVAAALCSAGIINLHNPGAGALIGGVMLGSLLPDIDSPNSKINHIIRRLLIPKGLRRAASGAARSFSSFHHRKNITHWPLFWIAACMALYMILRSYPPFPELFIGLAAGTTTHLLCDMLNPYGILLLAPFSGKKFRIASIPTNSMGEMIFLIASILISVILAASTMKTL